MMACDILQSEEYVSHVPLNCAKEAALLSCLEGLQCIFS